MDNLAETIKQLEISLFQAATRNSTNELEKLLANDFKEFMASGGVYYKQDALIRLPSEEALQVSAGDFLVKKLTDKSALITYRSVYWRTTAAKQYSLRSSIWQKNEGRWQMVFHQGTLCPPFELIEETNEVIQS